MPPIRMKDALEAAYRDLLVQIESQYLNIPTLLGGVGIGKTEGAFSLCMRLAEELDDQILFEAIATGEAADPTDTVGIPWVLPVEGNATKEEFKVLWALNRAAFAACRYPVMLLFDDIDKAQPLVVNALLNLFVHRRFKDFKLHPRSVMMCAGNRAADDASANDLSESIKTRITIIEVEPHIADFTKWAMTAPDPNHPYVHPMLLGWLQAKPDLLHKHDSGVYRFPTPRGYREASLHMYKYPLDTEWKEILERKIGTPAANDFWVWYSIYRNIDVEYILDHGRLSSAIVAPQGTPTDVAERLGEFAAVFAVVDYLNKHVPPGRKGIEPFIDKLPPEMRVAFLLQFNEKAKAEFRKHYPTIAGRIMGTIVKGGAPSPTSNSTGP